MKEKKIEKVERITINLDKLTEKKILLLFVYENVLLASLELEKDTTFESEHGKLKILPCISCGWICHDSDYMKMWTGEKSSVQTWSLPLATSKRGTGVLFQALLDVEKEYEKSILAICNKS